MDRSLSLSCPLHASHTQITRFLKSQERWLRDNLKLLPDQPPITHNSAIPYLGESTKLTPSTAPRVIYKDGTLHIPQDKPLLPTLRAYLITQARAACTHASDYYADQLGCSYSAITLKDTKSRWGSCSHAGRLMYSWRLILAPPSVLKYVAAHEVCHLVEMNHSARFWGHVARLDPNYETARRWLRTHGSDLMRLPLNPTAS